LEHLAVYVAIGFAAQMIDGALGMAYGVTASSFLLTFGMPPVIVSASVHASEVLTTGVSAASHHSFGNVDKDLVKRLIIPGVIGAIIGAYILTSIPGDSIRPFVSAYLLIVGFSILKKAVRKAAHNNVRTRVAPLGFIGGFLDAIGGGGWGPIVVSTLLGRGNQVRFTIGSVNFAEFFVTLAASVTFALILGLSHWQAITGLAIGGALAAPLAAYLCRIVPARVLMASVGGLIVFLSARTLYRVFI
jgi:uncharacterized membrane protein YfcA